MTRRTEGSALGSALNPRAIAIIGASEDPNKIGGRPLHYLSRFGYRGRIYAVNPNRPTVQGHRSFPDVASLPEAPDLALIVTPGAQVEQAVRDCAARGVGTSVVMASGFAETYDTAAIECERRMVACARAAGMRILGPNSQGLANFGTGTVASFSTMFLEVPPADGPVAIISQSGAMSVVPYALLRERGIGVRHAHATGNDSDITLPELALAVVQDPIVRVLLLYIESIRDASTLAKVAAVARQQDVPIVAIKAGRTPRGQEAARVHTGAVANDDLLVDAFLRAHGIWRARDVHDMVDIAELHLKHWSPMGNRLAVVSNSGAGCVTAADVVESAGLELTNLAKSTVAAVAAQLPAFATATNPIDLTAALIGNSGLLNGVLPVLASDDAVDLLLISLPVAGVGYDVPSFARAAANFSARTNKPAVATATQPSVAAVFRETGVPAFRSEARAIAALAALTHHVRLIRRPRLPEPNAPRLQLPPENTRFLSVAQGLACMSSLGLPVTPYQLCRSPEEAREAFRQFGPRLLLKVSGTDWPIATADGFGRRGLFTEEEVGLTYTELESSVRYRGLVHDGIIVAPIPDGRLEIWIAVSVDPIFGPVLRAGVGGDRGAAAGNAACFIPPVDVDDIRDACRPLLMARLLEAARGDPRLDVESMRAAIATLLQLVAPPAGQLISIHLSAFVGCQKGLSFIIGDAQVERERGGESSAPR